ncbi:hypothetical protein [Planococcus donghaensis]|uniref:Uncharacterized protein n=1 Tax=Planococcus donghaensis TaxID=414778 RepID=A0A1C7EEA9_9BACL|nr:hypothetical protein [Planococcus donghaensis]ANU22016.1 hypothetical protein BCM40_01090 [Planococcus donghaensis]
MNAKFENKLMVFENERYATEMTITGKGEGHDRGEPRLRCAVSIKLQAKETENELNLRANIYWDAKYPKTHLFFTGGSLVEFIGQQGDDYSQFKTAYWNKVKRLSANAFTDEEVLEYQKMMSASKA